MGASEAGLWPRMGKLCGAWLRPFAVIQGDVEADAKSERKAAEQAPLYKKASRALVERSLLRCFVSDVDCCFALDLQRPQSEPSTAAGSGRRGEGVRAKRVPCHPWEGITAVYGKQRRSPPQRGGECFNPRLADGRCGSGDLAKHESNSCGEAARKPLPLVIGQANQGCRSRQPAIADQINESANRAIPSRLRFHAGRRFHSAHVSASLSARYSASICRMRATTPAS